MKVLWTLRARDDLDRLVRFIRGKNPFAARVLADRLFRAGQDLAFMPDRFRPGDEPGTRERVVGDHIIIYRHLNDTIEIIALWHGKEHRQPDEAEEEVPA